MRASNIEDYLPRAELEVGLGESTAPMEEDDDEQMDIEYLIVTIINGYSF